MKKAFWLVIMILLAVSIALTACGQKNIIEGRVLRQYSELTEQGFDYYLVLDVKDKVGASHIITIKIDDSVFASYPRGCTAIIDLSDKNYRIVK